MQVPLLDLRAQYAPMKEEILAAVAEICDSQRFILGEKVEILEKELAAYCQSGGSRCFQRFRRPFDCPDGRENQTR